MRNFISLGIIGLTVFFLLGLMGDGVVQATSKNLIATKREKFKNDNTASMKDVFAKKEAKEAEYREKMLSNSDRTIELLIQIRDLLTQQNEKK